MPATKYAAGAPNPSLCRDREERPPATIATTATNAPPAARAAMFVLVRLDWPPAVHHVGNLPARSGSGENKA